jgi:hypothetical protein
MTCTVCTELYLQYGTLLFDKNIFSYNKRKLGEFNGLFYLRAIGTHDREPAKCVMDVLQNISGSIGGFQVTRNGPEQRYLIVKNCKLFQRVS